MKTIVVSLLLAAAAAAAPLQIHVNDPAGQALPCRIHFFNEAGKPQFAKGLPAWHDHFVCNGAASLDLPVGNYRYEIERGPEQAAARGTVRVKNDGAELTVNLKRIADLAKDGWFSGDLHIHRPLKDVPLLIRAEDLHIAPVITWWNNRNLWKDQKLPAQMLRRLDGPRFIHVMAGEDEREGGALLYFNMNQPIDITGSTREYPSPMKFFNTVRRHHPDAWVDIEKPFWWDVPVWLASGQADSIALANNHMCRSTVYAGEAWGRPRDVKRLPPPRGNGFWTQEIYYHLLNCGLRLPPSAGSASGVLPNPVGYNRVYVKMGGELTWKKWWRGLKAGRSFVTNGPLLLARANGRLPGTVFRSNDGRIVLRIDIELTTRDRVREIEIIKNGAVDVRIPCADTPCQQLKASVEFTGIGWFLVRAITTRKDTFRFASTAPFYVEAGPPRVSRESARFFLNWVKERQARVPNKLKDAAKLREVLAHHQQARKYWGQKLRHANAD